MTTLLAAIGQWTSTDELPTAGSWHGQHDGVIPLSGDTFLVAGGADGTGKALNTAAIYDVSDETWTATPDMKEARRLHTMTRLDDGTILVSGGITGASGFPSEGLATAEIYDPGANTWTKTGNLHEGRWGHSAVLLADKKRVLVAGGTKRRSGSSHTALRSAEIFDTETGEWTEAEPMNDARSGHPAVLLSNGRVLVAGGSTPIAGDDDAALAFCELYDATTGKWTPTGNLATPRTRQQATLLDSGVLVTGGDSPAAPGDGTFNPFSHATAELYNPASGGWTATSRKLPFGRTAHRAVKLTDGKVLVIGGTDSARTDVGYQNAVIFDPAAGTWTPTGGLNVGRWAFAAVALAGGKALIAGGVVRSGAATTAPGTDELTKSTEIWSPT